MFFVTCVSVKVSGDYVNLRSNLQLFCASFGLKGSCVDDTSHGLCMDKSFKSNHALIIIYKIMHLVGQSRDLISDPLPSVVIPSLALDAPSWQRCFVSKEWYGIHTGTLGVESTVGFHVVHFGRYMHCIVTLRRLCVVKLIRIKLFWLYTKLLLDWFQDCLWICMYNWSVYSTKLCC